MKIGHFIIAPIARALPENIYCALVNLRCIFRGRSMRFSRNADIGCYVARHPHEMIYVARRNRYKLYDKGITKRVTDLAHVYMLDRVKLQPEDHFIDCGANIGELGVWAKQFGVNYHAFEPEEKEAFCCDLNNFNSQQHTQRKALWFEETELKFYSKPESADSSAIEISAYTNVKRIDATTLSRYIETQGINKLRLLKVEAEGAEPEVLQGAKEVLGFIDYISVDCGNERGKAQLPTFAECNEILLNAGFELISTHPMRHTYLYKRIGALE